MWGSASRGRYEELGWYWSLDAQVRPRKPCVPRFSKSPWRISGAALDQAAQILFFFVFSGLL